MTSSFQDRGRAESFGAVATDYDRFRPSYPPALVDDLVAAHPQTLLDVGCGTGIATRLFAERGVRTLGVEVDPQMAEVARSHGLEVEVGPFEGWDARGRTFDLIISAQAWHWVDPAVAGPKAAALLTEGGTLALFWNFDELDPAAKAAVDAVYDRLAPQLQRSVVVGAEQRHADRPHVPDLRATGAFGSITTRTYRWEREYSVDAWTGMVGTHSDHLALGPERLGEIAAELREVLSDPIRVRGGTYEILARVAA